MTSQEIRQQFIQFFKNKNHKEVPSAPVVPHGDPTLLFTNAGMNQFKDVFLGQGTRDYTRAVDTQKCIRVSGKHNDLEEVGVDTYHHTFFEMLGNWSFGDFYKKEAIAWSWELLTEVWKLPKDRLFVTVYNTDDEAYEYWKEHISEDRIQRFDEKDNFWEMGDTGPCGPCSEIHYDGTPDKSGADLVNADHPDVIEIWNLVFIQYNRKADKSLEDLQQRHVDTGMGFERITRVIQGKDSNYDTDIFMPLINKISELCGIKYISDLENKDSIAMRVIADHVRTVAFSIADGALPGNEGRGYVLRRVLRRASRFARNLGFKEPLIYKLVSVLVETMGDVFNEIRQQEDMVTKIIKGEEESFLQTLDNGLIKFDEIAKSSVNNVISGSDAFLLYDSFGFPLDLTELIARENEMLVDVEGFDQKMNEQKERSRSARKVSSQEAETSSINEISEFVGYEKNEMKSKVLYVNENQIVLDQTPFYVESGGQISDTGVIVWNGSEYKVETTKKSQDAIIHLSDQIFDIPVGEEVVARIDSVKRNKIRKNHSATHLLHEALKLVLGSHIQQQGSLVNDQYLRFDFNHFEKVSKDELNKIEKLVNTKIFESHKVVTEVLTLDEAREDSRIKMYFGDKYGEHVRAVFMDDTYSIELCGGTHVSNTSEIGMLKIIAESSVASGVRRIEAITGPAIESYIDSLNKKLDKKEEEKLELANTIKKLEKEINAMKAEQLSEGLDNLISEAIEVDGIKVLAKQIESDGMDQLRDLGDKLRNDFGKNGIGLLASVSGEKVQLVCVVTDDLTKSKPAGKLVGAAAKELGGGGGGKPHMATAGGRDATKLPSLLESGFVEIIKNI